MLPTNVMSFMKKVSGTLYQHVSYSQVVNLHKLSTYWLMTSFPEYVSLIFGQSVDFTLVLLMFVGLLFFYLYINS